MNEKELEIKEIEKNEIDKIWKEVAKVCGNESIVLGKQIINQLINISSPQIDIINILENMKAIAPKDHIEAMLVSQMIATQNLIMRCFRRISSMFDSDAWNAVEVGNDTVNAVNKLMRTYIMQIETLNRYRGKGQQKMTVEHVHINDGGKAIIGNINSTKENKEQ